MSIIDVGRHTELTHVGISNSDARILLKFLYTSQAPAACGPGMFMYKMCSPFKLVSIQSTAKLYMPNRALNQLLVLAVPFNIVLALRLGELL